jgi:tRNA pseudouridine38-40 synthase
VQDEVEKALRRLGWQGKHILAAGRTDTGVHAAGQVAAFDLDWNHSDQDLLRALNANLPADIAVSAVQPVANEFDPRRHAVSRCYQYHIFVQEDRDPLMERYNWRIWPPVNVDTLAETAAIMVGEFDFRAFGRAPKPGASTVRTVQSSGWTHRENGLIFEVQANAFLYHMVRRMVIVQVEIGQGRLSVDFLKNLLQAQPGLRVQGLAPPQGLFLTSVTYPKDGSIA